MRFFGVRLGVEGRGLPPRRSLRRLVGLFLAAIPFGLGFLGILIDERRRGWQDRLAGVDVLYEGRERLGGAVVDPRRGASRSAPQRRRPREPGAFGRSRYRRACG